MSQVIAGIYEIDKKIGAGGSGIVYLGRHIRLEKQVVLKADKRTLSTGKEALRREVDMLKGLSHTYIPQVYDFVQEDGVVYTVMDFIEGESLDKLLGRRELPGQPQVIRWACQLLNALRYLHERPPHGILHGDIKPANIMLRPNGDVCLIDFNIALALGEDGAVKVGFSRGYASPEHYGADYLNSNRPAAVEPLPGSEVHGTGKEPDKTLAAGDPEETMVDSQRTLCVGNAFSVKSTSNGRQGLLLDVRSDIYSLGATLYHLLSGQRPAQDAKQVRPLGAEVCSPAVSAILRRAMAPEPEDRYQSSEEMLAAFLQLGRRDERVIRHKRAVKITAAVLTSCFLLGGASSFLGLTQMKQRQSALTLAEYSANALAKGDVPGAVSQALQAIPKEKGLLSVPVPAQAQKALTDALGVYDLAEGFKPLDTVELPSAPFDIAVSPEGTCLGVLYAYELALFDMENQRKLAALPIQPSALSDAVFVDETHVIYAGDQGVTAYDLDAQEVLWTGHKAVMLTLSGDGSRIAAADPGEGYAVIYRASDGAMLSECSFEGRQMAAAVNPVFADPGNYIFSLNEDGSILAVSFRDGGLILFGPEEAEDILVYDTSGYRHFEGGFYGNYFAFAAQQEGSSRFCIIDIREAVPVAGYESQNGLMLQTNEQGICLADGNLLIALSPGAPAASDWTQRELAYTGSRNVISFCAGDAYTLTATQDQCFSFYDSGANRMSEEHSNENCDFVRLTREYAVIGNRSETSLRLMKLENHSGSQLLTYDARYEHDEARLSPQDHTVMLFSCQGFCIYTMDGELLVQEQLPEPDYIYDQQFIRSSEGSWLEVTWYDGIVRCYSAADGALISEQTGEAPDRNLDEEFYTDQYRITSSLHEAPKVYDLKSGRLVAELEKDDYLTYVTQTGEYLITEYISASGERYGLLLDEEFQKLADLPGLCDVLEDGLVFDYQSGNLRQCRLYSLQELIALGETYITNQEGEKQR